MKRPSCLILACLSLMTLSAQIVEVENLGRIEFPTSGKPEAQTHFTRGVLLLHSFEFEDAAEEFQKAQQLDPDFAMACWGEAMTHNHPLWRQVDVTAARRVLNRLGATSEERLARAPTRREKDFLLTLEALYGEGDKSERDRAYSEALGKMHQAYPDDSEVAAFYALSILGLTNGRRDFRNYMKAASIAEEVFARNPHHPGAVHYLIHSYDDPIHAPLGLRAARLYAEIAPAASHAQHMISHIYVALGRWDESATANANAWMVSRERMERKGLDVDELDFHSFSWLHYSLLQQGRYEQAYPMLKVVEEAARKFPENSYSARMRAAHVVETRRWNSRLPAATDSYIDQFADAYIALNTGKLDSADNIIAGFKTEQEPAHVMKMQLEGLLMVRRGDSEKGVEKLRQAAELQDTYPLRYGPPLPVKPSHELLGEVLLELDRPREALEAFQNALLGAPRRVLSLLGQARAAERSGDTELARESYAEVAEIWENADPDLREWPEVKGNLTDSTGRAEKADTTRSRERR